MLEQSNEINIKRIIIESEKKDLIFDPRKDITIADLDFIANEANPEINGYLSTTKRSKIMESLAILGTIFNRKYANKKITELQMQRIENAMSFDVVVEQAAIMRLVDPDLDMTKIKSKTYMKGFEQGKAYLPKENFRRSPDGIPLYLVRKNLLIIFPTLVIEPTLDSADWNDIFFCFDNAEDLAIDSLERDDQQFSIWAETMANTKWLHPEQMAKYKIKAHYWNKWIKDLKDARVAKNPQDFARLASSLSILSAEKIECTECRIKLTFPNDSQQFTQIPKLPERRSF